MEEKNQTEKNEEEKNKIKGKVKVKLSLCLINKHYAMKAYGEVDHTFLTSALAGGEWSASRPGRLNPGERTPVPIG
jgi:hypothetical protein